MSNSLALALCEPWVLVLERTLIHDWRFRRTNRSTDPVDCDPPIQSLL